MKDESSGPWVLALDIGTSSARALIFDADGRAVRGLRAQAEYRMRTDPPGASEIDADALVNHAASCIDNVLQAAGKDAGRISAVGVCTFWHSMVGVDARNRAVTPLYTWADARPADAARRLQKRLDLDAVHARTGCAIHPSYFPARLLWLAETQPELYARVSRWVSPGEYLFLRLFGEADCSLSMASATGLLDQNRCDWDAELLQVLALSPASFSPLTDTDRTLSGLQGEWAGRWPALARVPWVPAIGDGAASNLGSGCATDRRIAINLGTSGAIRVLWRAERVQIPPELWCYRLDRSRFVMGGAFSDGGEVYAWMRRALLLPESAQIEQELASRLPDCHGLTFLPFLGGERSIGWRPDARATLHGLSLSTTPLDILQAGMEAVALRFALVADVLRRYFPRAEEIVASGGALAQSPVWARMIADALGHPLIFSSESEASSRGAALVALKSADLLADEADAPAPLGPLVQPDRERHEAYRRALTRQQDLYRRLL